MRSGIQNAKNATPAIVSLVLAFHVADAQAGKLDSFESSVRSRTTTSSGSHSHCSSGTDDCLGDLLPPLFGPSFFEVFLEGFFVEGGRASFDRLTTGPDSSDASIRRIGEPLIPFLAVEPAWQMLRSDVEGWDLQAEIGFGAVALQGRFTQYREQDPPDQLNVTRAQLLYRISMGKEAELDFGLGALFLDGDQEVSRFSFSAPLRIHPGGPVGFEFRPAWSENLADYDIALYLTLKNVSLKGGYRWLNSPAESLNGPYIGLSLRL